MWSPNAILFTVCKYFAFINLFMDQTEQMARSRLIRTHNIGLMTYGLLMRRYGSATDAVAAIPAMAIRGGRHISLASLASAKAELELIDAVGATLL